MGAGQHQAFQDFRRDLVQAQLPADMTLGEVHGNCQVAHCSELTGFHAPPPGTCATDGAQEMRILGLVLTLPPQADMFTVFL